MIALVAGFFLVAYLLAPGAIYRLAFSYYIPSKRFQRTRTEEITFSVLVTLIPFAMTWLLLLHTPLGHFPVFGDNITKAAAYKSVFGSILVDGNLDSSKLTGSYGRAVSEQARFVVCLWLLCFGEGFWAGTVVSKYGDYTKGTWKLFLCDKFLLKHVSEWQVVFTTLPLPSKDPKQVVEIDAMSTANVLYRGRLVNWFTDQDGKLAGIFLGCAERYQREDLARDRAATIIKRTESYWKPIPGSNLYLTAASLTNYNIRYVEPTSTEIVEEELGINVKITPMPDAEEIDTTPTPSPHP